MTDNPQYAANGNKDHGFALGVLTSLFFMMGFITCLNDVLIPHLKDVFDLDNSEAMLVQTAFFSAYLLSAAAGRLVDKIGYQAAVAGGFLLTAAGAFLFWPATALLPAGGADKTLYYAVFLPVFFIMACGIMLLQVAGNPYVTLLSRPGRESATLTLVQAFNSAATTVAPYAGALFILGGAAESLNAAQKAQSMQLPYLGLAGVLLLLAGAVSMLKLPKAVSEAEPLPNVSAGGRGGAWQYPHLRFGVLAIFCYVGAEVAIGSQYVLTMEAVSGGVLGHQQGAKLLSLYWGGAMVGRFAGSWLLYRFPAQKVLAFNALCAVLILLAVVCFGSRWTALVQYGLLAVGLFNSIMFPTIFSLAARNLGRFTADASGWLCTAIVGGAVIPYVQGLAVGSGGHYLISYLIPALCYAYIVFFARYGSRV